MKLGRIAGIAAAICAFACNGAVVPLGGGSSQNNGVASGADGGTNAAVPGDTPTFDDPGFPTLTSANKVDIVLAVDDSAGMKVKQEYFARSLGSFLQTVSTATSDIHLGVITSSLGNAGGNVCDPANPAKNRMAHLQRVDDKGAVVVTGGVLTLNPAAGVPAFVADAQRLVRGVGEQGCGLEAQLESVYRFLVQTDPYDAVRLDPFAQADLGQTVDVDVLKDRAAFLRPDSLVVVLMVTDEDDSNPDPRSVGGFGYAFANRDFPGSSVRRGTTAQGTTAPRATSACDVNPNSPDCTSCGFAANCDQQKADCKKIRQDPSCTASADGVQSGVGYDGFYPPTDDDLNVRFFHMKQRFGVDPQYPIDRYVAGFSASGEGDRDDEHPSTVGPSGQREIGPYTYRKRCTNPLFAAELPKTTGDELCNLPRGPRSPNLVVFGLLAGVAPELVEAPNVNWTQVLGTDPEHFDYSGIDPHMAQSITPRPPLLPGGDPNLPRGVNGSDPVTGREWNTQKKDLQYACTFALPAPISCQVSTDGCDCADDPAHPGAPSNNAPLCAADGSAVQTMGKAYPSTRELLVAKKLGPRAMVGSVCPRPGTDAYADFMTRFEGVVLPRLHP